MLNIHEKVSFNAAIEIATQEIVRNHLTNPIVNTDFGKIFIDVTGYRPYSNDPVSEKQFCYTPWDHAPVDSRTKSYIRDESIEHCVQIPFYASTTITKMILAQAFAHCLLAHLEINDAEIDRVVTFFWASTYQKYNIDAQMLAKRWIKAMYPVTGHFGMHDKMSPIIIGRIVDAGKAAEKKAKGICKVHHHDYDADAYWGSHGIPSTMEDRFDAMVAELIFKLKMATISGHGDEKEKAKIFYVRMTQYLSKFGEESACGPVVIMNKMIKVFGENNKVDKEAEADQEAGGNLGDQEQ